CNSRMEVARSAFGGVTAGSSAQANVTRHRAIVDSAHFATAGVTSDQRITPPSRGSCCIYLSANYGYCRLWVNGATGVTRSRLIVFCWGSEMSGRATPKIVPVWEVLC